MRHLATLSLACLLLSTPALAQTLDQATADQLATELNATVSEAFAAYGNDIKLDAPITASITTDSYIINVSPVTITLKGEAVLKLPATTASMRPVGTDCYTYESAFPSPITVLDAAGKQTGQIGVTSQKVTGSWKRGVPAGAAFPLTDIRLGGVLYKDAAGIELVKIGQLTVNNTSSINEAGKLNQSTISKVAEFVARDTAGKKAISIGELGLEAYLVDADAAAMENMRKKAAEMRTSLDAARTANAQNPEQLGKLAGASVVESMSKFFGEFTKVGGSSLLKGRLSNLAYLDKSTPMPTTFRMATLALGGEVKADPATGLVTYNTVYKHNGLELSPAPSDISADFIPKILSLNISIENLPLVRLMEIGSQALKVETAGAPAPATAKADMQAEVKAVLEQAGTSFKINELAAMTAEMAGSLKGQLTATQTSPFGAVGSFDAVIKGLDEYLADMKVNLLAAQKAGDQDTLMESQGMFMGMTMLQGMGEKSTVGTSSSRIYKIVLSPEGTLTINGVPLPGG